MSRDLAFADVQLGGVADPLLAFEHLDEIALLCRRPERQVTRPVVVQGVGRQFPDLDARRHELAHRRLEVVVAHDAAGDAGGTRADAGLVDDKDLLAALREVPGRRKAVNARTDHQVSGAAAHQCNGGSQPSRTGASHASPTVREPSTQGPSSGWGNLAWRSLSAIP